MQKTIFSGVLILCALPAQTQTNKNIAAAIYIGAADIQATLKKAPADSVTDRLASYRRTGIPESILTPLSNLYDPSMSR